MKWLLENDIKQSVHWDRATSRYRYFKRFIQNLNHFTLDGSDQKLLCQLAENQPLNRKPNPMWLHVLLLRERIGMEQNWTILYKVDSVKTVRTGLTSSTLSLYVSICLSIYRSWSYAVNISCWLSLSDNFSTEISTINLALLSSLKLLWSTTFKFQAHSICIEPTWFKTNSIKGEMSSVDWASGRDLEAKVAVSYLEACVLTASSLFGTCALRLLSLHRLQLLYVPSLSFSSPAAREALPLTLAPLPTIQLVLNSMGSTLRDS